MNNLQKNFSGSNSRIFTAFPPLPGLFVNDLYSDSQGQFILKPIDSARIQQPSESHTFLQIPTQFLFWFGIKHQFMCSFICSREGQCRKQTKRKTMCPRSILRSLYCDIQLDYRENIPFVPQIVDISWYVKTPLYAHVCVWIYIFCPVRRWFHRVSWSKQKMTFEFT